MRSITNRRVDVTVDSHNSTPPASFAVAVEDLAGDITEQILQPRRTYLKHRVPRSQYVEHVRRGMACRRSKPVAKLLAVALADIEDGAPVSMVVRGFESIIEILKAHAEAHAAGRPDQGNLRGVMRLETRAQARLDDAQLRVAEDITDPAALDALLSASADYDAVQARMESIARGTLAELDARRVLPLRARHPVPATP